MDEVETRLRNLEKVVQGHAAARDQLARTVDRLQTQVEALGRKVDALAAGLTP